jgi:hypothetical protein
MDSVAPYPISLLPMHDISEFTSFVESYNNPAEPPCHNNYILGMYTFSSLLLIPGSPPLDVVADALLLLHV